MYSTVSKLSLFIILAMIIGCASQARQSGTTEKIVERVGVEQGQPTQVTETTRERTVTDIQASAGVDVGKVVTAAMSVFEGKFMTALAQLKPSEQSPSNGIDGLTGGIGAAAASLGLIALREFMARKKAQQDADEEWQRANASHAREVELAKQLPPTQPIATTKTTP